MALESLDLESKVFLPTQQLINHLHAQLINYYLQLRQYLVDVHAQLAAKGLEWYENPVATSELWYQQSVAYAAQLYNQAQLVWLPKAESSYEDMLSSASDLGLKVKANVDFMVDNPEVVTADVIESVTESVVTLKAVSAEMAEALQTKTAEIVALLLDKPWQTLENASLDLLNSLIQNYFELVSSILVAV